MERADPRDRRTALTALVVVVALEVARVFFVLVSFRGELTGTTSDALLAGVFAVVVFLSPLLSPIFFKAFGRRGSVVAAVAAVVSIRIAVHLVRPVPIGLAAAGAAFALIALTLVFVTMEREGGAAGRLRYVLGVLLGLTLDTALRTLDRSWDSAWHDGPLALLVAVLLGATTLALALVSTGGSPHERTTILPVAALGPFLMLQLLFLQSPAFVASAGGTSLMVASAVVLVGDALTILAVTTVGGPGIDRLGRILAAVAAVALAFFLPGVEGAGIVAVVVAGQVLAGLLLTMAFVSRAREGELTVWRGSVAFALAGVTAVLLIFLYQVHYRVALPFPNTLLPPAAMLLLGLNAIGAKPRNGGWVPFRQPGLAAIPAGLLLIPFALGVVSPNLQTEEGDGRRFRLVSYNVHSAVGVEGQLDPDGIAEAIERTDPDVVALQEVGRGWVIGGTTDLAEWLSHRLGLPYVFAPAADRQFGNLVLSRLPILRAESDFLPQIEGAQRRSALEVEIDLGQGRSVTLIDTHLEGEDRDQRAQVERLIAGWGGRPRTLIVGDLNMQPDDPMRARFDEAGLISAQDEAGQGEESTAAEPKFPGDRVDWIFGTVDLSFSEFRIDHSSASDHLPLIVTTTIT